MKHLFLLSAFLVLAGCGEKRKPLVSYSGDAAPIKVPVDSTDTALDGNNSEGDMPSIKPGTT